MTTIQEIMKKAYKGYEEAHSLPRYVRSTARALIQCRTSELGGHIQACPNRHYHRQWYNSCRNRICPQCNWIRIEQWLEKQAKRLLACGHYHMIFTIPHELNGLWIMNVKAMTDLLFRAVKDTIYEFFLDARHIGGKPGIIATLHTWSQTMILHPHIHCLVTEGGLINNQWMSTRQKGYLLPIRAVMALFRGKFLAYIDTSIAKGIIILPEDMTIQRWKNLKNKLGRVKWNVHVRERYDQGKGILIYLSRYIRGGAMSNKRIISHTERGVTFSHRALKGRDTMTLPVDQFIQRYLLHIPCPYTKVVRYYGIYASTAKDVLSFCRDLFGQEAVNEHNTIDWQTSCETKGDNHPEKCPLCGCRLIRMMNIPGIPHSINKEVISYAA